MKRYREVNDDKGRLISDLTEMITHASSEIISVYKEYLNPVNINKIIEKDFLDHRVPPFNVTEKERMNFLRNQIPEFERLMNELNGIYEATNQRPLTSLSPFFIERYDGPTFTPNRILQEFKNGNLNTIQIWHMITKRKKTPKEFFQALSWYRENVDNTIPINTSYWKTMIIPGMHSSYWESLEAYKKQQQKLLLNRLTNETQLSLDTANLVRRNLDLPQIRRKQDGGRQFLRNGLFFND